MEVSRTHHSASISIEPVRIPVGKNHFMLVDPADAELVGQHKWAALPGKYTTYAQSHSVPRILAHRLITGALKGQIVDHLDGNGLNNCRSNLRVCSLAENNRNARIRRGNRTGYKGVISEKGRYSARIGVDSRKVRLGVFDSPELAAKAYDAAAVQYYGQFARLNFPEVQQ